MARPQTPDKRRPRRLVRGLRALIFALVALLVVVIVHEGTPSLLALAAVLGAFVALATIAFIRKLW